MSDADQNHTWNYKVPLKRILGVILIVPLSVTLGFGHFIAKIGGVVGFIAYAILFCLYYSIFWLSGVKYRPTFDNRVSCILMEASEYAFDDDSSPFLRLIVQFAELMFNE